MESVGAIVSTEPITHTPDRHDITRLAWVRLNFRAKSVDMRIDGMFIAFVSEAPHLVQQLATGIDPARVLREVCQQIKLLGCQFDFMPVDVNLAIVQIDAQAIVVELCRACPLRLSATLANCSRSVK